MASRQSSTTGVRCRTRTRSHWGVWRGSVWSPCIGMHPHCLFPLYDMCFHGILGECLPERDAAAAPPLSRHPELSGCVVSQRCAPGGASRCGKDPAGPQSGGRSWSQPGGGQRARGTKWVPSVCLNYIIITITICLVKFANTVFIMMWELVRKCKWEAAEW